MTATLRYPYLSRDDLHPTPAPVLPGQRALFAKPTNKERTLANLQRVGVKGLCLYDVERGLGHRLAARVWDLRQDGIEVLSGTCPVHHSPHRYDPDPPHARYYLPGLKPSQEDLPL